MHDAVEQTSGTAAGGAGAVSDEAQLLTGADTDLPAGAAGTAEERPSFSTRGRMRRRMRFLRKARELAYRDLGGLVFSLHRFDQRNDPLVLAKLTTLEQIDGELRAIEEALQERQSMTVLREAGVSACPRCAAIHSSEDRFCPNCGLALAPGAGLPGELRSGAASAATGTPLPAADAAPDEEGATSSPAEDANPTTEPSTTAEPTAAEPTAAEPTAAEPPTAEPTAAEPTAAEPTAAEPTTAEPTAAEPTAAEPSTTTVPPPDPAAGERTGPAPDDEQTVIVKRSFIGW